MSEDPSPKPSQPRRHRPRLTELSRETTEDDLWDLDAEPEKPVQPSPREPESAEVPQADEGAAGADSPTSEDEPAPPEEPVPADAPEEPTEAGPEALPETPSADDPSPAPTPGAARPQRREWISLGALAAIFAGLAIWWITGLFRDIPTQRLGEDEPDFPVAGSHAEVSNAETYWRAPIREGENRDAARPEVAFIPVVSLELSGGSGALRAIFRDQHGQSIGDVITRSFENGRFRGSGSPTIEFAGTDGYASEADFSGYRVGTERWTVEILEAPSEDARGSEFKTLLTAPLSTERR